MIGFDRLLFFLIAFSICKRSKSRLLFEVRGKVVGIGKTDRKSDLRYGLIGAAQKSFGFLKTYLIYFGLQRHFTDLFEDLSQIRLGIVQLFGKLVTVEAFHFIIIYQPQRFVI